MLFERALAETIRVIRRGVGRQMRGQMNHPYQHTVIMRCDSLTSVKDGYLGLLLNVGDEQ
jgi:hypothetical protein